MPVSEISTRVSSSEITEWSIYFRLKNEEMEKQSKANTPPSTNHRSRR